MSKFKVQIDEIMIVYGENLYQLSRLWVKIDFFLTNNFEVFDTGLYVLMLNLLNYKFGHSRLCLINS